MAGRPQRTELSEKHWKVLKLAEEGTLNIGEICKEMGWDEKYYYNLRTGNVEGAGAIATLFKIEYEKIEQKRDSKIKALVKENTELAQSIIKTDLTELKSKKHRTLEEKKLIGTLQNALSKCTPSVSIGSLSYSYTKGLNPEDLIREFKRLETVASQSFDRRAVSGSSEGGTGDLSGVDESRD